MSSQQEQQRQNLKSTHTKSNSCEKTKKKTITIFNRSTHC